jgi:hypothetical protein
MDTPKTPERSANALRLFANDLRALKTCARVLSVDLKAAKDWRNDPAFTAEVKEKNERILRTRLCDLSDAAQAIHFSLEAARNGDGDIGSLEKIIESLTR